MNGIVDRSRSRPVSRAHFSCANLVPPRLGGSGPGADDGAATGRYVIDTNGISRRRRYSSRNIGGAGRAPRRRPSGGEGPVCHGGPFVETLSNDGGGLGG